MSDLLFFLFKLILRQRVGENYLMNLEISWMKLLKGQKRRFAIWKYLQIRWKISNSFFVTTFLEMEVHPFEQDFLWG